MKWVSRLRPNILVVIVGVALLGWGGLEHDAKEITAGAVAGLILLAKDIIMAEVRIAEADDNEKDGQSVGRTVDISTRQKDNGENT